MRAPVDGSDRTRAAAVTIRRSHVGKRDVVEEGVDVDDPTVTAGVVSTTMAPDEDDVGDGGSKIVTTMSASVTRRIAPLTMPIHALNRSAMIVITPRRPRLHTWRPNTPE